MNLLPYIFMFSIVALFASQDNFNVLYEQYEGVIVGVFILSAAVLMYRYIVLEKKFGFFDYKEILSNLERLHPDERVYFKNAVHEDSNTILGEPWDPALILLCERKLIKKIKNTHLPEKDAIYLIKDQVWEKIRNNPAIL